MKMSEEELFQYEQILNQETLDIFNYITAKDEVPEVEKRKPSILPPFMCGFGNTFFLFPM
jgi:succinate dehydrogenase flavin-adding protein (antitoxin of CptAB toxin-antitoxin module)